MYWIDPFPDWTPDELRGFHRELWCWQFRPTEKATSKHPWCDLLELIGTDPHNQYGLKKAWDAIMPRVRVVTAEKSQEAFQSESISEHHIARMDKECRWFFFGILLAIEAGKSGLSKFERMTRKERLSFGAKLSKQMKEIVRDLKSMELDQRFIELFPDTLDQIDFHGSLNWLSASEVLLALADQVGEACAHKPLFQRPGTPYADRRYFIIRVHRFIRQELGRGFPEVVAALARATFDEPDIGRQQVAEALKSLDGELPSPDDDCWDLDYP